MVYGVRFLTRALQNVSKRYPKKRYATNEFPIMNIEDREAQNCYA
jgi:hypothetical protein